MADNWVAAEKGIFGKAGWQPGGAHYQPPKEKSAAGEFLNNIRPRQIKLLEELIARTADPLVKTRLERALKPWKAWNDEPRWWAFPDFGTAK
jgi:hypothetical protein